MKWTVEMLIEELQNMPADAEVRLAFQKRYPLEYTFGDVALARDGKVYIGEGTQVGYLMDEGEEALEW